MLLPGDRWLGNRLRIGNLRISAAQPEILGAVNEKPPVADPVTGAYPRALLPPRLDEELARAARAGTPFAVFLFDVDFFKTVNDAYGHQRGDLVLRQMADRVSGIVRPYDSLFRYGGDEFVLLLPEVERDEAIRVALQIADGIRDTPFPGTPPLTLSVSLGVAAYPGDGTDAETLLAVADRRNYLAKRRGRACAVADDADVTAGDGGSSRLWERDAALAAISEFLTRLEVAGRGALRIAGEPGAGHTRFLDEVATIAAMRGWQVMPVGSAPPPEGDRLLLTADTDAGPQAVGAAIRAVHGRIGLAYASTDPADSAEPPLELLATAHLAPWTPAAVKIWLRNALRGEPSRALVNWLFRSSGGLPGPAARALTHLRDRGGLTPVEGGGWTVAPAMLGRARHRNALPTPMTRLVGRAAERRQVARLLAGGRLVTLAGPGGIGKTRLALAAAADVQDDFDDGAVFVPLAEATDTGGVVAALGQALRVPGGPDELVDELVDALAERSTLLVLDNFEQAVEAAPVIGTILAGAPDVSVLVTSRERLGLYGEQVYPVPPLAAPEPAAARTMDLAADLARWPALALFDQRARAVNAAFELSAGELPVVAELCARLDCLPLAIELAAGWSELWSPRELLDRLGGHLDGLGPALRDLPERQRTLRGAVEWSFRLLSPADRRLFVEVGVFVDGCTVGGVLAVLDRMASPGQDDDHALRRKEVTERLHRLADKSLLVGFTDAQGWLRWRMLETVRAYAVESLHGDDDERLVRRAHAAHYVDFAERLGAELTGPNQVNWSGRAEREYANVRAAFEWSFTDDDPASAARICLGLWRYWRNGNMIGEGRVWLDRVLSVATRRADLLYAAAVLAGEQGDHPTGYRLASESLAAAAGDPAAEAQAHNALGISASAAGDYALASRHFRQMLDLCDPDDDPRLPMALGNLANLSLRLGDIEAARAYADRCLTLERAAGNTFGIGLALECLGQVQLAVGDSAGARASFTESLGLSRELGDGFGEAMALHQLGACASADGDRVAALRLCTDALARRHELNDREDLPVSLDMVAALSADDAPEFAAMLLGAADELRDRDRLAPRRDTAVEEALRGHPAARRSGRTTPLDLLVDEALDRRPAD
ncbi:hypothetical protein Acsp02_25140 [Actinoplanes sp. NBRC 103695]|nr:hypothetical protein Acsp02_25140 [Actinoplanes sp. NBRC 103695]